MNQQDELVAGEHTATAFGGDWVAPKRVAFVVNSDRAFVTHRAVWARALQAGGAQVKVFAPDTGYADRIRQMGIEFRPLDLGRESIGAAAALMTAIKLTSALLLYRPQLAFLVQTAAYSLGWPAALFLFRSRFVRVAGGRGRGLAVSDSRRHATRSLRLLLTLGSRLHNVHTLFQLESDRIGFLSAGLAHPDRSWTIPGTGVDTKLWSPPTAAKPARIVLFASRLYEEKGVRAFARLARLFAARPERFVLVGEPDLGVTSTVHEEEIRGWVDQGAIEWWGHQDDMISVFRQASVFVFPSTHPEGTPKVLIEAAACGVPSIAYEQPGCRAVIDDGVTGWIVETMAEDALAQRLREVLDDPDLLEAAGSAARMRAVQEYSLPVVLTALFEHLKLPRRQRAAQ